MSDTRSMQRLIHVYFVLNLLQGYLWAINGTASPYLAEEFGLSETRLASYFGIFAIGALGTLSLSRLADRIGRRRLMLLACGSTPVLALGSFFAPNASSYAAIQIGMTALLGTLFAVGVVVITEELPLEWRAKGQGTVGLGSGLGAGLALVLIGVATGVFGSWRWLWVPVVPGILLLPLLRRLLPETDRFRLAEDLGETHDSQMRELMRSRFRPRALAVLSAAFLGNAANVAAMTWGMYHLIHDLELGQATASGILIIGGGIAIAGFPIGARLCDALGRRRVGAWGSLISTILALVFFLAPRETPYLIPLLALTFGVGGMARTAKMVAWRASATELFPTRLRAAVQGWAAVMGAASGIFAQFSTAAMVPITGSLVEAASVVVLLGLPAALVFLMVPETAGIELESASLEEEAAVTYVALGSNVGDRAAQLDWALNALSATPGIAVMKTSPLYETEPIGGPPQGSYLNSVVKLRTTLAPRALLESLLRIEREAGRTRSDVRNAPRSLDLDLLLYADCCLDEEGLVLPHPRLHERLFVLAPLRDVAPGLVHPKLGESVEVLAGRLAGIGGVRPFAG